MQSKFTSRFNSRMGSRFPDGGGGNSSVVPLVLNPVAWLKADFIPLGEVASYTDPVGITYTQSTESARPTNTADQIGGRRGLVFDGGDALELPSVLYGIGEGGHTIFVVSEGTAVGSQQDIIDFSASNDSKVYIRDNIDAIPDLVGYGASAAAGISGASEVASAGLANPHITTAYRDGTSQSLSINGGATDVEANATDVMATEAFIGSFRGIAAFYTGSIAEIIIYNRALSASEIAVVEQYLSNYYGIALA